MYKAKLQQIENQINDSVTVNIIFYNGKKEFTKSYNFHASNMKTTDEIRDFIANECANLDSLEETVSAITPLIGVEDIVGELK